MKLAAVEYMFMFDPTKTWARLYQFETELKSLLDARDLEGVIIDTVGRGGKKIVYIKPKDKLDKPAEVSDGTSVKERFKQVAPVVKKKVMKRDKVKDIPVRRKKQKKLSFRKGKKFKTSVRFKK
ncbi:MAG: hypothetical protein GY861_05305 [bacterium]|nr:hypothetical protein [bacterium]